ncbi:uncharacterized protein [Battus philenor]|uniref:uncharacterized protein n=1 Tax=Battus philenor TaxID=42288 RepID=UPI0035D05F64
MGNGYTTHALIFLNEGLTESTLSEKDDIIQGCIHADICNVFEDHSIITSLITWSRKYKNYGDQMTQVMAAQIVHKIARSEEGRRYLNYNSKITYDIKYALKKYTNTFNSVTLEPLTATLDLLQQHFTQNLSISYYCKPIHKGVGVKTLLDLSKRQSVIPLEEMVLNLELLSNLSKLDRGKMELIPYVPDLLNLLKRVLRDYDNSEINIVATNLLNNVISRSMLKDNSFIMENTVLVKSIGTEPTEMKNEIVQVNEKKKSKKHRLRSDKKLPTEQGTLYESPILNEIKEIYDKTKRQVIVVPLK